MPSARHAKVKDLLFAACLVPPSERGAFLDRSCADDDLVRREVESLLSFYDDPPATATESVRVRRPTQPKARYRKGHIVAGRYRDRTDGRAGGMGEVYHAYDGLMRQPVALKVLHVSDDVHRRRLVEEVRLARQVTHASVCRVHDVGEHEGSPFLTMELIQGVDLAARLARSGPLPSDEVTRHRGAPVQGASGGARCRSAPSRSQAVEHPDRPPGRHLHHRLRYRDPPSAHARDSRVRGRPVRHPRPTWRPKRRTRPVR